MLSQIRAATRRAREHRWPRHQSFETQRRQHRAQRRERRDDAGGAMIEQRRPQAAEKRQMHEINRKGSFA